MRSVTFVSTSRSDFATISSIIELSQLTKKVKIPKNIRIIIQKSTMITLFSNDLLCLKQVSTSLKKVKAIDNYKGKGLLYVNEQPNLKENTKKQV